MKAITLRQPYATAVASRLKQYETRSWATSHRGEVIIHAGRNGRSRELSLLETPPFASLAGIALPFGAAVATAEIVDVVPTGQIALLPEKSIPEAQFSFGDFSPGRFAWKLENIRPFCKPIPKQGEQGLWDWALFPLYTFGYTGSTPDILKDTAEKLGAAVVDIRFSRRSRAVRWTGKRLAEALGKRYVYIGELGNRNYKERGAIQIADLDGGLHRLLELLLRQPAILLCACKGWRQCHRRTVAEAAAARYGVAVHHLSGNGDLPQFFEESIAM